MLYRENGHKVEKRLGNARLNGGGKEGNRWKKLRRREEERSEEAAIFEKLTRN